MFSRREKFIFLSTLPDEYVVCFFENFNLSWSDNYVDKELCGLQEYATTKTHCSLLNNIQNFILIFLC